MKLTKEIWKPVKNYEGLYEVSNCWRLKSLPKQYIDRWNHVVVTKERMLSPSYRPEHGGEYVCGLTKNGKTKQHYVHILVADAFNREVPFENLNKEVWKFIPKTPYQISNMGRVRVKRKTYNSTKATFTNFKIIKPSNNGNYLFVKVNSGKRMGYVHRLVAKAFVPNPHNYRVVNHLDGNKLNNKANNLEWTTFEGNSLHAFKTGLSPAGINSVKSYFSLDDLKMIYCISTIGLKYADISSVTGFNKRNIYNFLIGRTYKRESKLIKENA